MLSNWLIGPAPLTTPSALARKAKPQAAANAKAPAKAKLGTLPEWNLADLYPGAGCAELKADLETSERAADAMQERYAGKLAELADGGKGGSGARRGRARVRGARATCIGRIVSYASLLYAGDTSDPARQKFFGDIQEKITAISSNLLFFPLELNRIDDAVLETAMADSELGHYRPWLEDLRKEKPYQLEDKLEQLFHEKSVTGRGAWNRLFNETMTALRFDVDGEKLSLEPTLNLLLDQDETKRRRRPKRLAQGLQGESAPVHADHQHARQGQGDLRPLARLRRCRRFAPSRQPRRAGGGRRAGRRRARRLSAPVAPLLRA